MKEEWKEIISLYRKYSISNFGNVKNNKNKKILKSKIGSTGYFEICFRPNGRDGKYLNLKIHRLVAEYFCNNPDPINKTFVNHKDGIKTNNLSTNLEWVTRQENVNHAVYSGLMKSPKGEDHHASKLKNEDIKYIRNNYKSGSKTFGAKALAKKFGVNYRTISDIANNKCWQHII